MSPFITGRDLCVDLGYQGEKNVKLLVNDLKWLGLIYLFFEKSLGEAGGIHHQLLRGQNVVIFTISRCICRVFLGTIVLNHRHHWVLSPLFHFLTHSFDKTVLDLLIVLTIFWNYVIKIILTFMVFRFIIFFLVTFHIIILQNFLSLSFVQLILDFLLNVSVNDPKGLIKRVWERGF